LPDHLLFPDSLRMQIAGFPPNIRDAANLLIMSLLGDSVPPDAKPFAELSKYPSYQLTNELVTVFYSLLGDDTVFVNAVHPNT
jgi:hypothetical protein